MFRLLQFAMVGIAIFFTILQYKKLGVKKSLLIMLTILFSAGVSSYIMQYEPFNVIPPEAGRLLTYYKKSILFFSWAILFALIESLLLWCTNFKKRIKMTDKTFLYAYVFLVNLFAVLTANQDSLFGIYSIYIYRVSMTVVVIFGISYYFTKDQSKIESEGDV
ncbi:MAG: hypothetical protein R3Y53_06900 [Bacillota bacterium]